MGKRLLVASLSGLKNGFERFLAWFAMDTLAKLKRSEVRCVPVFGDTLMRREPLSRQ